MDLSIIEKVSQLASEGRNATEIKQELHVSGVSPEVADQALKEAGIQLPPSQAEVPTGTTAPLAALNEHHTKVIQPTPGFDPSAK